MWLNLVLVQTSVISEESCLYKRVSLAYAELNPPAISLIGRIPRLQSLSSHHHHSCLLIGEDFGAKVRVLIWEHEPLLLGDLALPTLLVRCPDGLFIVYSLFKTLDLIGETLADQVQELACSALTPLCLEK